MIRVSVMYPKSDGATFDMDYYRTTHMDIVQQSIPGVTRTEIDHAIDGPYLAVGHLFFESLEAMQSSMGAPSAGAALGDIPNFTNTQPVMQVSRVVS
jgi:uncharacterized protein (TIGR02118 family)